MRDLPYCPAPPAAPLLQPAAPDVNPIGSALASGLWISSQAVYNSRRPVSSLLRALWRSLAYILSTTYSLVSYILSPFLTVLTTLLLSPARTLLDLADALKPFFVFVLTAVVLGCLAGAFLGYTIETSLTSYARYWRSSIRSCTDQSEPIQETDSTQVSPSHQPAVKVYTATGDLISDENMADLELASSLASADASRVKGAPKHVSWAPILEHTSRARSPSPGNGSPNRRRSNVTRKRGARRPSLTHSTTA